MSLPKRLEVSWNGQVVGLLVDVEDQTALVPVVDEDGRVSGNGSPKEAKFSGRWIPANTMASSEFVSSLNVNDRPEVSVLPYSTYMKVVFLLQPDGTARLYCRQKG